MAMGSSSHGTRGPPSVLAAGPRSLALAPCALARGSHLGCARLTSSAMMPEGANILYMGVGQLVLDAEMLARCVLGRCLSVGSERGM
eukprot:3128958-Rhodomonas_salina.2